MNLVILIRIFKPENRKQRIFDRVATDIGWGQSAPHLFVDPVSIG